MKKPTIYAIVLLIGGYICFQLIADVAATKIVSLFGVTMPAGTFVFALTFTWRDMIHKRLGKEWARAAIITAALANILLAGYLAMAIQMQAPIWWGNQEAFRIILGFIPRITIASIIAEVVSEWVDTEVYQALIPRISERQQWGRVLGSNAVSLPLDSLIFTSLAFAGTMPLAGLWSIAKGQVVFKALVTLVSLPLIYAVPEQSILPEFVAVD